MRHPLTDTYRAERAQLLGLGGTLSESQGSEISDACPEWSVKDIYAHLAGISSDILAGNTEGAATPEWADVHVADRVDASLAEVLAEWSEAGDGVSSVMEAVGDAFPFQLFVDQWTHGWDIRAAIGASAAATPDTTVFTHYLDEFFQIMVSDSPAEAPALTVRVGSASFDLGAGEQIGQLDLSLFEFARVSMGRRSAAQLAALPWPATLVDTSPYVDALVRWSVNDRDVVDPVI